MPVEVQGLVALEATHVERLAQVRGRVGRRHLPSRTGIAQYGSAGGNKTCRARSIRSRADTIRGLLKVGGETPADFRAAITALAERVARNGDERYAIHRRSW